jgi:hypothetical protein
LKVASRRRACKSGSRRKTKRRQVIDLAASLSWLRGQDLNL